MTSIGTTKHIIKGGHRGPWGEKGRYGGSNDNEEYDGRRMKSPNISSARHYTKEKSTTVRNRIPVRTRVNFSHASEKL